MPDTKTVTTGELAITGLSFADSFNQNVKITATKPFHIVMGHGPDFALAKPEADLLVAGHTHGGQICAPGGIVLRKVSYGHKYFRGHYQISPKTQLYVSRGIGTVGIHARLFCRPEIAILELTNTARRSA
jgi:predicted MPP superfamily phosphohydrolase